MKVNRPTLTAICAAPIGSQVMAWKDYKNNPQDFTIFTKYENENKTWFYASKSANGQFNKKWVYGFPPLVAFHKLVLITNEGIN